MGGKPKVTDLLLSLVKLAASVDEAVWGEGGRIAEVLEIIRQKHTEAVQSMPDESRERILSLIDRDFSDIQNLLRATKVMRHADARILEVVSGYGEQWSSQILAELLNLGDKCTDGSWLYLDAREVLKVEA